MEAPLSASVVLAFAVTLWLVWVSPYVLRMRKAPAVDMATDSAAEQLESLDEGTDVSEQAAGQQEFPVKKMPEQKTPLQNASAPTPLRLHSDRIAVAAIGLVALLGIPVTGVLRLLGLGSIWLVGLCVVLLVASVASLRAMKVSSAKRRVDQAFREAMSAPSAPVESAPRLGSSSTGLSRPGEQSAPVAASGKAVLFDGAAGEQVAAPAASKPIRRPAPMTAAQLREAALAVARGASVSSDGTWEPVEVPKPSYVDAAKAERPAPAPLDLPQEPKPAAATTLKEAQASAAPSATVTPATAAPAKQAVGAPAPQRTAAQNNLDTVLQRRRA
ncbi:hypothetical protein [Psychromicrobium xiongbiense]|uniref:hypothetical protein n=1 Tax=Psychromicrobium xiongbiense TaxID=3051184 RepID=UPI002556D10F|nr:hypothetical protein [Psychromicrobium sp. YIM S02556]